MTIGHTANGCQRFEIRLVPVPIAVVLTWMQTVNTRLSSRYISSYTLPCVLFESKREPGSGASSIELYLPVKKPPATKLSGVSNEIILESVGGPAYED